MTQKHHLACFGDRVLVRVDKDNDPWIMNRPDKGWAEYGYKVRWNYLAMLQGWEVGERYRDEYSEGFWLVRCNHPEKETQTHTQTERKTP